MAIDPVVRELLSLLDEQRAKAEPLERRLAEIQDKIEKIEGTIQMYSESRKLDGIEPEQALIEAIKGKTHREALAIIAKANDGLVKSAEAKRLFLAAGLAKGKVKNLGPHLWQLLNASQEFQRIDAGVFRLIGSREPRLLRAQS